MPGTSRARKDAKWDAVVMALATGKTAIAAAAEAGVGVRTVHRWKSSGPELQEDINRVRNELVEANLASLIGIGGTAVDSLNDLLDAQSESARLGAVRVVLNQLVKLKDSVELERRVASLEEQLKEVADPVTEATADDLSSPPRVRPR